MDKSMKEGQLVRERSIPDKASGTASPSSRHVKIAVGGMTCGHCPPLVERALKEVDGVVSAHVNLSTKTASINYDPARVTCPFYLFHPP